MRSFLLSICAAGTLIALSSCPKNCGPKDKAPLPEAGLAGIHDNLGDEKKERPILEGKVAEVIQIEGFSYLRLVTPNQEEKWVALLKNKSKVGDSIRVEEQAVLTDFHSKSLNRTFPTLVFGVVVH